MALKLVAPSGSPAVLIASGRPYQVGRSIACDLAIQDPTVSRQHAELQLAGAGLRVRDLGSTNGTFLNGERVSDAVAMPGARLSFGKVDFEVREEAAPTQTPGDGSLDATILRQVRLRGPADIAAQLSAEPAGASALRILGASPGDRQERKLALLLDVAKELSQQPDVDLLLDRIVGLTFQVMDVDRVAILMPEPGAAEGDLVPRVWRSRAGVPAAGPAPSWRVPRSIVRRAVADRVAVLIENAAADRRFQGTSVPTALRSALCAPMLGKQGMVLGVIYLDNLGATHSFSEEDLEFLSAFSGMAAVAIENSQLIGRMRREAVVVSNFQRYFGPDLARQIAGEEGAVQLGGAKRRVVILFSDIRDFTALSEPMSPDEIATLLTGYFTEMVEIVFEHGGTLDKFIGDALMALWGAPRAHWDDAGRAVRAAIAMQQRLARLNQEWEARGRRPLAVGIGLDAGEVFAGNIGSERRLEYTVLGDAVNTAARLCAEAGPGEILVAGGLIEALAEPPPVTALDPLPLKGKAQPVPVFRVEWREAPDAEGSGSRREGPVTQA
ncbi:MAG TPA: adenylate/guanylate cyclase domain-containing protein [Thermoanaerobaculia bacterium]|nr:adenylate/guanylate cyclase domain-containing protein [Thermoanaerobaculia bacterium]